MNVGIVGLGLIGGSLARSTKARTLHTVYAADIDRETMMLARLCGAIDGELTDGNLPDCALVLLALRPGDTLEWVRAHADRFARGAILVDMCGVKRAMVPALSAVAAAHGFSYIGGHPMAGRERGGFVSSADDLFVDAAMILTPDEKTDMAMLETLKAFFSDIGFASLTFTTPEEHDRIIAYTSQLAHIVSSAYVRSPDALRRRGFSAGSFRDMTRVARLDEEMWTELMFDNADNLEAQLGTLIGHLEEYRAALRGGDREALRALLRDGREKKAEAGGN